MRDSTNTSAALTRLAVTALLFGAGAAGAQMPTTGAIQGGATEDSDELQAITVTAQRRTQQAQDVPIALQVVTAKQIDTLAVSDLSQMNGYVPGLTVNGPASVNGDQPTQPVYTLRGISVTDFGIGTDSPIGIYEDGVYTGKTGGALLMFDDVEHVEVLKGPQGTLFGRNSAAGAISIATQAPSREWEEVARLRLGNYGEHYFEGVLNAPLAESLALRLSFVDNQSDGWLRDAVTGQRYQKNDDWGLRAQLQWWAADGTSVRLVVEHEELNQPARAAISVLALPTDPNAVVPYPADPATYIDPRTAPLRNDAIGQQERRHFTGATLLVEHPFAAVTLTSITAWRHFTTVNRQDYDGTNLIGDYADSINQEGNTSWSQELKLSGKNRIADWIGGVSYYHDDAFQTSGVRFFTNSIDTLLGNTGLAPGGLYGPLTAAMQANGLPNSLLGDLWDEDMYNHGVAKAYAAYGDVIWHLTDRWNLTTGARVTHDQRQFSWYNPVRYAPQLDATLANPTVQGFLQAAGVPLATFQQNLIFNTPISTGAPLEASASWNNFSPRAVLDYKVDSNTMLYASATRGYQAGGFNALLPGSHYEPETVRNYEAGVKSYFPQAGVLLNASLYYYQYLDLQSLNLVANGGNALPLYLVTISDQHAAGLDLEAHWHATDALRFDLTAAYIDATYNRGTVISGTDVSGQPTGEPLWSLAGGFSYLWHEAGGDLELTVMDAWRGATRCNASSAFQGTCLRTPAFTVGAAQNRTDARLGWSNARWGLAVYVNNAFDKRYVQGINNVMTPTFGTPFASISAPRFWGVEGTLHF